MEELLKQLIEGQKRLEENQRKTDLRFDKIDSHLEKMDSRLDNVESHLNKMDSRLDNVESCLDKMDSRLDNVESRLDKIDSRLDKVEEGQKNLETKVDMIDKKLDTLALTTQKDVTSMLGHVEAKIDRVLAIQTIQGESINILALRQLKTEAEVETLKKKIN